MVSRNSNVSSFGLFGPFDIAGLVFGPFEQLKLRASFSQQSGSMQVKAFNEPHIGRTSKKHIVIYTKSKHFFF